MLTSIRDSFNRFTRISQSLRFRQYSAEFRWQDFWESQFGFNSDVKNWPMGIDGQRRPSYLWVHGHRILLYAAGNISLEQVGDAKKGLEWAIAELHLDIDVQFAGSDDYIDRAVSYSSVGSTRVINALRLAFGNDKVDRLGSIVDSGQNLTNLIRRHFKENADQIIEDLRKHNHIDVDMLTARLMCDPRRDQLRGGGYYAVAVLTDKLMVQRDNGVWKADHLDLGYGGFWTGTILLTGNQDNYDLRLSAKHELVHLAGFTEHHDAFMGSKDCLMLSEPYSLDLCGNCHQGVDLFLNGMRRRSGIDLRK